MLAGRAECYQAQPLSHSEEEAWADVVVFGQEINPQSMRSVSLIF